MNPNTAPPDPFPNEFALRHKLGEGAFGTVWLADDLNLGIPVALKTITQGRPDERRAAALRMLRDEAKVLASLRHPNVVQVRAWRESAGEHYLVLEYVPGGSLAQLLFEHETLPWERAARFAADVADGLAAVHAAGVVHRDIKPANVLWDDRTDEARLTDFGVAAHLATPGSPAGTTPYMAPEAFRGDVGPAVDVYALSATLFQLISGEVPFAPHHDRDHLPDDARLAAAPEPIERVIRAGLVPDPAGRPTVGELAAALRGALNRALTDAIAAQGGGGVRIEVERLDPRAGYRPLATSRSVGLVPRDLKKVPAPAGRVVVRTGDRVRVRVTAERDGHLCVFTLGASGKLELLLPETAGGPLPFVRAGSTIDVAEADLCPPTGTERVLAILSRAAAPFDLTHLSGLADMAGNPTTRPYRATRDLEKVRSAVQALAPADADVAVVELDHVPR